MVLFQGFKRQFNKINPQKEGHPSGIYPIKRALELLSTKDNQEFISTIKSLVKPSRRFNEYYYPVIEKFAEFVQNLPENQRGFFGQETEFLTHGLERASRTLCLCLGQFFPEQDSFSNISNVDALWIYATFTAALFLDIGKIAVKYSIMLYHQKAYPLKKWDPYTTSMLDQGSYYKFEYIKENFNNLRGFITPVLARQLLDSMAKYTSEAGAFNWIASDPIVLEAWFALLAGDEARIPMTSFMSMIPRAEIETVDNYRKISKIAGTQPAGEAFLEWLRKELADGRIIINEKDSKLNVTKKEIFLSGTLFQMFCSTNAHFKHPEIVERQFIDVAKLYNISISELEQRSSAHGGLSGKIDSDKRNRTIGGISAIQGNQKILPQRFLKGDVRLASLIIPQSLAHTEKNILKLSIPPQLTR